jgi:hypothetical protein
MRERPAATFETDCELFMRETSVFFFVQPTRVQGRRVAPFILTLAPCGTLGKARGGAQTATKNEKKPHNRRRSAAEWGRLRGEEREREKLSCESDLTTQKRIAQNAEFCTRVPAGL